MDSRQPRLGRLDVSVRGHAAASIEHRDLTGRAVDVDRGTVANPRAACARSDDGGDPHLQRDDAGVGCVAPMVRDDRFDEWSMQFDRRGMVISHSASVGAKPWTRVAGRTSKTRRTDKVERVVMSSP